MIKTFQLALNPDLDVDAFAAAYARDRFVQIGPLFSEETATALADMMLSRLPWRFVYADPNEGTVYLTQQQMQAEGQAGMATRMQGVMERATRNYGYCYNAYPMIEAVSFGWDPGHPIHELTEFINSRAFLDFGQTVIGRTDITKADAQATLYTKGSFLTRHIDDGAKLERRAAYTIGFTRNWMTDWGGQLQFLDENTDIERAYLPRWNMLTIFDGLRIHAVSPVSAFAGHPRLSIAGWLRNDPPGS